MKRHRLNQILKTSMNYSRFLPLSCLLFSLGCQTKTVDPSPLEAQVAKSILTQRYGEIEGEFERSYLQYLMQRLVPSESSTPTVTILDTPQAFAASSGSSLIVISRGLILSLKNEAQLAFIVAHELSHFLLAHPSHDISDRRQIELDADTYGLGLLAKAGYNPWEAYAALAVGAHAHAWGQMADGYPSLSERQSNIQTCILASHWQAPGTVDRRDFQTLKLRLRFVSH